MYTIVRCHVYMYTQMPYVYLYSKFYNLQPFNFILTISTNRQFVTGAVLKRSSETTQDSAELRTVIQYVI